MHALMGTLLLLGATTSVPASVSIVTTQTSATGGASASAVVETNVTSSDGSSVVHVDTSVDGVEHHATYSGKTPIEVHVEASSSGYKATSNVAPVRGAAVSITTQAASTTASSSAEATSTQNARFVPFFINMLHWFGGWTHWFGW